MRNLENRKLNGNALELFSVTTVYCFSYDVIEFCIIIVKFCKLYCIVWTLDLLTINEYLNNCVCTSCDSFYQLKISICDMMDDHCKDCLALNFFYVSNALLGAYD